MHVVEVTAVARLRRPLSQEQHQDATRGFAAAWMVVTQTSVRSSAAARQSELDSLIAREHLVAVLEGARLHRGMT